MSYKPYRVLKVIIAVVNEGDDTLACYPHGKVGSRMEGTGKVGIVFSRGVINAPTDEEIALFSLPALSKSVKPIPQDPRGFDKRLSGVARSFKGAQRGREAGIIEKHERESAKAKRKIEADPVPKSEPEVEAESVAPETTHEVSESLITNLEYLSPIAKASLVRANIVNISNLRGRTVEELDELPGIGVKLAERLLADYEAYLKTAEPIVDEIKEEGDNNE